MFQPKDTTEFHHIKKNTMINGIKGLLKVNEDHGCKFLFVHVEVLVILAF